MCCNYSGRKAGHHKQNSTDLKDIRLQRCGHGHGEIYTIYLYIIKALTIIMLGVESFIFRRCALQLKMQAVRGPSKGRHR